MAAVAAWEGELWGPVMAVFAGLEAASVGRRGVVAGRGFIWGFHWVYL